MVFEPVDNQINSTRRGHTHNTFGIVSLFLQGEGGPCSPWQQVGCRWDWPMTACSLALLRAFIWKVFPDSSILPGSHNAFKLSPRNTKSWSYTIRLPAECYYFQDFIDHPASVRNRRRVGTYSGSNILGMLGAELSNFEETC